MSERPIVADAPLLLAVQSIEASSRRIAVVIDAAGVLIGTLTDGDIRRCLLKGGSMQTRVGEAMNPAPLTASESSSDSHLLELMHRRNVLAVPIVDPLGRFVRLVHLADLAETAAEGGAEGFDFAVIMAGGEGKRLRPVTQNIPKPMVEIGGVPLLERQMRRLVRAGISRIYLSVNYLAHVIEDYFGDGSRIGVSLSYLREKDRLGTAGALALLPETPVKPILVMNGDIVTMVDFAGLLNFHRSQSAEVTVAAVDYHVNIPFGVIEVEGLRVSALKEKPAQRFLCNAGIYSISPGVLRLIPDGSYFDMTDLMASCLSGGLPVNVFPMHEYWSDIGTPDDLEKARKFFATTGQRDG